MKNTIYLFTFLCLIFAACNSPEDIVEPTHLTRVPVPTGLQAIKDTTVTGKAKISLTWTVSSMENIKTFEVQRAVSTTDKTGKDVKTKYYPMQPPVTVAAIVDSFSFTTDTVYAYYSVIPTGKDRFIGKGSDTLKVIITKLN